MGFEIEIAHLDGHNVKVARDGITWPGTGLVEPNEGMPSYENNTKMGALHVSFDIEFPKTPFTEEQKKCEGFLLGYVTAAGHANLYSNGSYLVISISSTVIRSLFEAQQSGPDVYNGF